MADKAVAPVDAVVVTITGPQGSGKTAVADIIKEALARPYRRRPTVVIIDGEQEWLIEGRKYDAS